MVVIGTTGKHIDDNGNKIPNDERMTYTNIKIIKDGATMPSEAKSKCKKYKN